MHAWLNAQDDDSAFFDATNILVSKDLDFGARLCEFLL